MNYKPEPRCYSSTREAFPSERLGSISGPYRPSLGARLWVWWPAIARGIAALTLFGAIGVMLGWGGR